MKVIVPGHVYELDELGGQTQTLTFIRRSGGAITHNRDWPGVQTQEVLRALIDRTKYLDKILPCTETADALEFLRLALYHYELRAWRRKQENVNQKAPTHDDSGRHRAWRAEPDEAPFTHHEIELRAVGKDGHLVLD